MLIVTVLAADVGVQELVDNVSVADGTTWVTVIVLVGASGAVTVITPVSAPVIPIVLCRFVWRFVLFALLHLQLPLTMHLLMKIC